MTKTVKNGKDPRAGDYKYEDGKYIIPLAHPFDYGENETITEFRLKKPNGGNLRKLSSPPTVNDLLNMVEALANQPKSVVDRLDCADSNKMMDFIGNFF